MTDLVLFSHPKPGPWRLATYPPTHISDLITFAADLICTCERGTVPHSAVSVVVSEEHAHIPWALKPDPPPTYIPKLQTTQTPQPCDGLCSVPTSAGYCILELCDPLLCSS